MPGRAIKTKFVKKILDGTAPRPIGCDYCLKKCSLKYCIIQALINAQQGNVDEGIVFTGNHVWKIKDKTVRPAAEVLNELVKEAEECERVRVVVTGLGCVTPIGIGKEAFWNNLTSGKSGVGNITHFDPARFSCQIAAEVKDFDPSLFMDKKDSRRIVHFIQFAIASAKLALADSKLSITPETPSVPAP